MIAFAVLRRVATRTLTPGLPRPKRTAPCRWDGLGNYFGGVNEGGPWEKFPELVKGEQKINIEDMKVGGSGGMKAMDGQVRGESACARSGEFGFHSGHSNFTSLAFWLTM